VQVFAGVFPPDPVRVGLAAAVEPAIRLQPELVWVPAPWWHLTLVHFPNVSLHDLAAVGTAVSHAVAMIQPPLLRTGRVGAYPDPTAAHELFVEVDSVDESLIELRSELLAAVRELGGTPDPRAFRQHIGLARSITATDVSGSVEVLAAYRSPSWAPNSISIVSVRPAIQVQPQYDLLAEHPFPNMSPPG
jgi:2'-5' RNA ligase